MRALALQPDGKIVIVGGFAFSVARLNPDGSSDTGFGDGSVRIVHAGFNSPKDVAAQGDGAQDLGDDVVRAASGDDVVCGGRGRDLLAGGQGGESCIRGARP
jgi:hypothetical protein